MEHHVIVQRSSGHNCLKYLTVARCKSGDVSNDYKTNSCGIGRMLFPSVPRLQSCHQDFAHVRFIDRFYLCLHASCIFFPTAVSLRPGKNLKPQALVKEVSLDRFTFSVSPRLLPKRDQETSLPLETLALRKH